MIHPDPRGKVFPYLFVEDEDNLTLIDPGFLAQIPMLEKYLQDIGYDIKNVKRIILTHVHVDHAQAANEVKRKSGARIYSHWIDARYLAHNPPYMGPPSTQETIKKLEKLGVTVESLSKEYGTLEVEPISVDEQVSRSSILQAILQVTYRFIMKKINCFWVLIVYIKRYLELRVCIYLHPKYRWIRQQR
jgi:ribonuclease BN (tRNA processing enzyme)